MKQAEPKVNILLVDDKPENLLALEAILGNEENIVQATSGEEALRCLLHQDFAVILLDVQMPGMDGFETANLIRSRQRSRETPIIFLTAFSTSEYMQFQGYAIGAVDYLFKPLNSEILVSKVKVFVELYKKTAALKQKTAQLTALNTELKQSEERFRSLSNYSPIGIFETNSQGDCIYTNPRYQEFSGVTHTENIGTCWLDSVHPDDSEQANTSWSNYICNGGEYSQEFRFLTTDNDVRWMSVRCSPMLNDDGQFLGHVGTLEDITERKTAEETRAQIFREQTARQEAEAANRMKDEFLAVLSHELRTPLTSMLGWSKILRTKKLDEQGMSRAINAIERNAIAQTQLIEDILDVSRIIRGQLRLSLSAVDPKSVVEAAIEAARPQTEAKDIQLNTCIDTYEGKISGDPIRLQQIVSNLLSNAIKFTPKGGRIDVHLQPIETSTVQITVSDTGIGIDPDFLPKVFDRFRQADSTTTRSHSGLGLGLAIVSHLVELHGGNITAYSAGKGQGATFTVQLPLIRKSSEKLNPKLSSSSPSSPSADITNLSIG
ncbi:MAG: ATP-binding protein [Nostocaceae cyanobacterium]|nr:ATP-binding protein [Nostocaceae cyanobacterium]